MSSIALPSSLVKNFLQSFLGKVAAALIGRRNDKAKRHFAAWLLFYTSIRFCDEFPVVNAKHSAVSLLSCNKS
jgi:hypothetical protein